MKAYSINIEHEARSNVAFRRVLYTGQKSQLVVMSLRPGEEIGAEIHPDTDQVYQVLDGIARIELEGGDFEIGEESLMIVPAGMRHNLSNPSLDHDLKLSAIFSPPLHLDGTLQMTRLDAEAGVKEALVDARVVGAGRLAAQRDDFRPGG